MFNTMQTPKVKTEKKVGEAQKRKITTEQEVYFQPSFSISLRWRRFFKNVGSHECSFKTTMLFKVFEVTLILASLASMILWSLSCMLAKGVLHTITKIVAKNAAMEGAALRFLWRMIKARVTLTGSNQTPWIYQQKSPILLAFTLIKFII